MATTNSTVNEPMSDPTEVLKNINDSITVARRIGDIEHVKYLKGIREQITSIWNAQCAR